MLESNNYKIVDNFLDKKNYQNVKDFITSQTLDWYFRETDTGDTRVTQNLNGFFSYGFYNDNRPNDPPLINIVAPMLRKLNSFSPVQVRANLVLRDIDTKESGWHTDFNHKEYGKTAIFYLTTCNAKTLLKIKNEIIEVGSVENRIVIFKSNTKHKVKYQTDVHKRYVINFNYI